MSTTPPRRQISEAIEISTLSALADWIVTPLFDRLAARRSESVMPFVTMLHAKDLTARPIEFYFVSVCC